MAIIVEEPKAPSAVIAVVTWGILFAVAAVTVYYLFFEQPALVEVAAPANLESANEISKINLDPQEVVQNPEFQALTPAPTAPSTAPVGRPNPFLAF